MARHSAARLIAGAVIAGCIALAGMSSGAMSADRIDAKVNKLILKRQYKQSAALLEKAAKAGNTTAQYRLGTFYRLGLGVSPDIDRARHWLKRAAASGDKKAAGLLKMLITEDRPSTVVTTLPVIGSDATFRPMVKADARDQAGLNWVMHAAARGLLMPLNSFIASGENVQTPAANGETPLLLASRMARDAAAEALLRSGAPVNGIDKKGRSPLLLSAAFGNADMTSKLITFGANPVLRDTDGASALWHAVKRCRYDSAMVLLQRGADGAANKDGQSPLHLAVRSCPRLALVDALTTLQDVNLADAEGRTALWYAASLGRADIADLLLRKNALPGIADSHGMTPLHIAALRNQTEIVTKLVTIGADVTFGTVSGDTPLMLAAAGKCIACITTLVRDRKAINRKNRFGDTALLIAVRSGNMETTALLLAAGGDISLRNDRRDTASLIAERMGNQAMIKLLSEH